jgi:hypothetical protein
VVNSGEGSDRRYFLAASLAEAADFHQVGTGCLFAPFTAAVFAPVKENPAAVFILADFYARRLIIRQSFSECASDAAQC